MNRFFIGYNGVVYNISKIWKLTREKNIVKIYFVENYYKSFIFDNEDIAANFCKQVCSPGIIHKIKEYFGYIICLL